MPYLTPPADHPTSEPATEPASESAPEEPFAPSTDGRRARRDRNADAVVNALLDIFREGEIYPSAQQVADRSGVSLRSVFRYFSDLNQLVVSAFTTQIERAAPLWVIDDAVAERPLAERIAYFAAHRTRLYIGIAPFGRAAAVRAPKLPFIAAAVEQRRASCRTHLRVLFAPELDRLPAGRREVELDCLDAATALEACDHLVFRLGRSEAELEAMLSLTVTRFVSSFA